MSLSTGSSSTVGWIMISEQQLVAFTKPASDTEEIQCDRATRMIREAMEAYLPLSRREYMVIAQGSYPNNTNARRNSDVDICVVMEDVQISDYSDAQGETSESYGLTPSHRIFGDDRNTVHRALIQRFGTGNVSAGTKAFDVHSVAGSRVDADVVPAWRFRAYRGRDARGLPVSRDGVVLWSTDGKMVINFPEQHRSEGTAKNRRTNGYFKSAVRILKHVRYDMLDEKLPVADGVSSFLLESLLYNVDDQHFTSAFTWETRMRNLLHHIHEGLKSGEAGEKWVEVSGFKWLFRPTYGLAANWTSEQARAFVLAAYNRIVR